MQGVERANGYAIRSLFFLLLLLVVVTLLRDVAIARLGVLKLAEREAYGEE